jgi:hypothetical protein
MLESLANTSGKHQPQADFPRAWPAPLAVNNWLASPQGTCQEKSRDYMSKPALIAITGPRLTSRILKQQE